MTRTRTLGRVLKHPFLEYTSAFGVVCGVPWPNEATSLGRVLEHPLETSNLLKWILLLCVCTSFKNSQEKSRTFYIASMSWILIENSAGRNNRLP